MLGVFNFSYLPAAAAEHVARARSTGCDLGARQFPPLHTRLALGDPPGRGECCFVRISGYLG